MRINTQRSANELRELEKIIQRVVQKVPGYPYEIALVARLSGLLEKRMADVLNETLKPLEMTAVLYHVLMIIHGSEDAATPTLISDLTGERPNNVTHLCKHLNAKGYITRRRVPDDGRRFQIDLTAEGRQILRKAQPLVWQAWQTRFTGFSAKNLADLPSVLTRQLLNLDRIGPGADG